MAACGRPGGGGRGVGLRPWLTATVLPAFALDTVAVSAGLGASGVSDRWRTAVTFAACEGLMPVLGAGVGSLLGHRLAAIGVWVGAALLVALGLHALREGWRELRAPAGEQGQDGRRRPPALWGWPLLAAGFAVSTDELAAGFAAGAAGLPLRVLAPALAVQAVLCTLIGLAAGARLRRLAGRYGELGAGLAWVAAGAVVALVATR